jgi:succinoglycan biosynthesis transport protein ExoP
VRLAEVADDRLASDSQTAGEGSEPALASGIRLLRRRKWTVITAAFCAAIAAALFSLGQPPKYEASAEVLLNNENLAGTLTGSSSTSGVSPDRIAQTQADLARVPLVARRVLRATEDSRTPDTFLSASDVAPKSNSDLLVFRVRDRNAPRATRLASAYAVAYTAYRRQLDTAALERARAGVQRRMARLKANRAERSPLFSALAAKDDQLQTLEALQMSNATVVRPATDAVKISPRPVKDVLLGLVLGLMLGIGIAFGLDSLDTRVRSVAAAAKLVGIPLLGRVPNLSTPPPDKPFTLVDPGSHEAEAFRILRTNVEFATLESPDWARVVMVTSGLQQEGKSTVAANLALAFARAGHRVVLVDLDLRRPSIEHAFGLGGRSGLTDVALRRTTLSQALVDLPVASEADDSPTANGSPVGKLRVLTSGTLPPDPGEFAVRSVVGEILAELAADADLVLVDVPPLLPVVDARALSAQIPAAIVVAHLPSARRPVLKELRRVLESLRSTPLGVIVVGSAEDEIDAYVPRGRQIRHARTSLRPTVSATRGHVPKNGRVNVNSATLEELIALPGIGPAAARRILDHRATHGSLRSLAELRAVSRIGPRRFDDLTRLIVM